MRARRRPEGGVAECDRMLRLLQNRRKVVPGVAGNHIQLEA
jgi:hypothetical protein